jgi:hypothetical protein
MSENTTPETEQGAVVRDASLTCPLPMGRRACAAGAPKPTAAHGVSSPPPSPPPQDRRKEPTAAAGPSQGDKYPWTPDARNVGTASAYGTDGKEYDRLVKDGHSEGVKRRFVNIIMGRVNSHFRVKFIKGARAAYPGLVEYDAEGQEHAGWGTFDLMEPEYVGGHHCAKPVLFFFGAWGAWGKKRGPNPITVTERSKTTGSMLQCCLKVLFSGDGYFGRLFEVSACLPAVSPGDGCTAG